MTQEQLDTNIEIWCLTSQESLGDYNLYVVDLESMPITYKVVISNKNIEHIGLPYEYIRKVHLPKMKAKIIIGLLEQIRDNGDEWLQQEKDYWVNLKENQEENNWESKRDYKD